MGFIRDSEVEGRKAVFGLGFLEDLVVGGSERHSGKWLP